ncbi:PEP-CTERM sorting domain-containing protein [bacterium]|nr:PEP-CTERM sorting domain-containing protein [bacterium]
MTKQIKLFSILYLIAITMLSAVSGYAANYTLGTEFQINTYTTGFQGNSSIASNGSDFLVTWDSNGQDGDREGVYGQRIDSSGNSVGNEFRINTYTTSTQGAPALASNGQDYLITWDSNGQDGDYFGVYGRRIDSSGNLTGNEFQINTYTTSTQGAPAVASNGQDYLITWTSNGQDGDREGVYGQRIDSSGNSVGNEFRINTYTTSIQGSPAVASNGQDYLITWNSYGQDGNAYGVYGRKIDSSGNLSGNEFRINTYTTNYQFASSITSNGQNYLVTWHSYGQDGDGYGVYGQLIDSNGNFIGAEFLINTYTTRGQVSTAVASNGEDYLITWNSYGQDGDGYGVYGQFIGSNGNFIDNEFLISTYTTSDQSTPSVAYNGHDFLVTWESSYQDGDSDGIYGKFISYDGSVIPEPASILLLLSGIGFLFGKHYKR